MTIQQHMGVIKASFCIVLVLNVVAVVSTEEKKEAREELLSQQFDPTSALLDEDTAEVQWTTCWEVLIHSKKELGDLDLCLPQELPSNNNGISSESGSIARENIQNLINTCHPQLKQKFLRCLRKHNLPFHVFTEELDSKIWHATYVGSLSSRRNLGHVLPQHVSKAQYNRAPPPPPKAKSGKIKKPGFKSPSKPERSGKKKAVILAIVITAVMTSVVVTMCFCCCFRRGRVRQNDEKPLLSMSMSDLSVGSSSNNNPHKSSMTDEKLGFESSSNNLSDDKKNSVQEVCSAAARPSFELKPPPGRVFGTIPLKPTPGKLDPLPPEPPSFENSSNATAAIAAAAASPPPAPPRPSNGGPPPPPAPLLPRKGGPPAPQPPPPPGLKGGPRPPPPPMGGAGPPRAPPRAPPPIGGKGPRPLGGGPKGQGNVGAGSEGGADAPKAKLKPFFWDKVQANSDQTMVWNQLKAGSFQFNEEMMETLFGYASVEKHKPAQKKESSFNDQSPQYIQIIEPKKAQNLSILLRALSVTLEEVCDALLEGNELPAEFLQTLLKMAPTSEEELKLRLFSGDLSLLSPADRFLKTLVDIPFAFKRIETLHYMCSVPEELTATRESFATLEVACKELKSSRLFLKLLEAVLKTGNRMNDGTFRGGAQAFKLDTLLKLSDVKGVDGKTTLLLFVVQEIIRTEGIRAARITKESHSFSSIKTDDLLEEITHESEDHYRELGLQVVSRLSNELENVKKAAALDADGLTGTTARLGQGLIKTKEFVNTDLKDAEGDKGFYEVTKSFVESAEADVTSLLEEEKKIMALVKSTGDYFHGNTGRDEGLRLFLIVRDFLIMLDKVCKEIKNAPKKPAAARNLKQENSSNSRGSSSSETRPPPPDFRQRLYPVAGDSRRMDDFSSDDDSP